VQKPLKMLKNAAAAGVENLIHFAVCDFAATQVPQNKAGVMMVNPEYGERLGDEQELEETYGRIGDFMKKNVAVILVTCLQAT
jgi:putative N6-adenine-specific DNA methylase